MEEDLALNEHAAFYETFPYPNHNHYLCECGRIDPKWETPFKSRWSSLKARRPLRILVAGCGTIETNIVARVYPRSDVVGVDLSETSVAVSRRLAALEHKSNMTWVVADLMLWEPTVTFDIIVATGLIHHVRDSTRLLGRFNRWLDPQGGCVTGMVYGGEDRAAVREGWNLFSDVPRTPDGVEEVRRRMSLLLPEHPMRRWYDTREQSASEIADTWLNPYYMDYTERSLKQLLECGGFCGVDTKTVPGKILFVATKKGEKTS